MYVYKMYFLLIFVGLINYVLSGSAADSYKDQYCTDPRTMKKHAAYSEWADAYSCTKHRCQPGGRNMAIYTVGCKRVEAPESAIECEEVVEDTNIQFPYCCTRLRCLMVVRGEVWTRVLGQPWETLPAAPWSHMYKMKKPPPPDITFLPKDAENGPIYELTEPEKYNQEKNLKSKKTDCQDSNKEVPDIVIALSTDNDEKNFKKADKQRHLRSRHNPSSDNGELLENELSDVDSILTTEKEPAAIYMAPVESRRKEPAHIVVSDSIEKKRKKHHKKRRGKVHGHKKHRKYEKKKTRTGSNEVEKNVSVENDSAVAYQNQ